MPRTPKSDDKRSRKDLELFVLALISREIATTYDLKMSAAISPGASVPVLSRLESSGYIKKGKDGARNRQEYAVTGKGSAFLKSSWKELFQAPPSADLEAILRTGALALLLGEPKRSVAAFLSRAAQRRKESGSSGSLPGDPDSAIKAFPWMREIAMLHRRRNEAMILRHLASKLGRTKIK
jgi:DNA-binding PadR family transcriptional regulator